MFVFYVRSSRSRRHPHPTSQRPNQVKFFLRDLADCMLTIPSTAPVFLRFENFDLDDRIAAAPQRMRGIVACQVIPSVM